MAAASSSSEAVYLGFDLSTQQLKAIAITSSFTTLLEESVTFDDDLPSYSTKKGVYTNPSEDEVFAPVHMWLEALDLLLSKLKKRNFDFSRVKGICGAGQQHGSVYWSKEPTDLNPKNTLKSEFEEKGLLSYEFSPNWQDHSTTLECSQVEDSIGGEEKLAECTGSKAHHRFTGPQILRFRRKHPEKYRVTKRISLVSSFLASVFLGRVAEIDISDVCGMNLWNIPSQSWNKQLLSLIDDENTDRLLSMLGNVTVDASKPLGRISEYFIRRYGFDESCVIAPFTGDNPSTLLALPLSPTDVVISLGTSTTLLMSTAVYKPDPAYHMFNHPTTKGLYMFMLCYKNGGLAREAIRDSLSTDGSWDAFNDAAVNTPPLGKTSNDDTRKVGFYFPLPEIVPDVSTPGTYRFSISASGHIFSSTEKDWKTPTSDCRAILESQALSMRLRSAPLTPHPRRVYIVGGGSKNNAIIRVLSDVIGATDGWYKLDIGGNACALGAAYKAAWTVEGGSNNTFEEYVGGRWKEEGKVEKVEGCGYKEGVWETYGEILEKFAEAEGMIVRGGSGE